MATFHLSARDTTAYDETWLYSDLVLRLDMST